MISCRVRCLPYGQPGDDAGKAACHSDYVDADEAKHLQSEVIIQLNTAPAHNLASEDRLI